MRELSEGGKKEIDPVLVNAVVMEAMAHEPLQDAVGRWEEDEARWEGTSYSLSSCEDVCHVSLSS